MTYGTKCEACVSREPSPVSPPAPELREATPVSPPRTGLGALSGPTAIALVQRLQPGFRLIRPKHLLGILFFPKTTT